MLTDFLPFLTAPWGRGLFGLAFESTQLTRLRTVAFESKPTLRNGVKRKRMVRALIQRVKTMWHLLLALISSYQTRLAIRREQGSMGLRAKGSPRHEFQNEPVREKDLVIKAVVRIRRQAIERNNFKFLGAKWRSGILLEGG